MKIRARPAALAIGGALLAGFVVATLLDPRIYHLVDPTLASRKSLEARVWYLALRNVGSLWTWLVVGAGLATAGVLRRANARPWLFGAYIALCAAAAGGCAELLKLIIARERPAKIMPTEGGAEALVYQGYHFRGLFAGFADGSNLGLPSSHAATAAGGAFAVALLWPRPGLAAVALAIGCGVTRVLSGAHFASDVYAGIVLGWIVARVVGKTLRVRHPGEPTA